METSKRKLKENDKMPNEPESSQNTPAATDGKTDIRLDWVRGCLFGGAAGDALGYPVEFMDETHIRARFGPDGITEYVPDPKTGKALVSDDTQMTLFTVTGCLRADTRLTLRGIAAPPHAYVLEHYLDWLRTQEVSHEMRKAELDAMREGERCSHSWLADEPRLYSRRAPGRTCISSLRAHRDGNEPCLLRNPTNGSKGCGGVMRVAPVGLYYVGSGRNMAMVDHEGAEVAALTHGHSLGWMPAAVLVHIVNRLVYPHDTLGPKSLHDIVLEACGTVAEIFPDNPHTGTLVSIVRRAVDLADGGKPDSECIREIGEGWVAEETLAIAVFCALRHENDFSAGIVAAVNHSGDSDSTGAVTGNILGARLGYGAIPRKWKTDLELADIIMELADDLRHG